MLSAKSISAVFRESCQPPWKGANSIGNVNFGLFGCAVLTVTVETTWDGFLSDQAMPSAAKLIGR